MRPIISKSIRVRYPKYFVIGNNSVVDDFCYFSTKVKVGRYCHIANGCSIAGGLQSQFVLGSFSSLSAGVRVWTASNDFVNDLVILSPQIDIGDCPVQGDVIIKGCSGIGANTVIMPNNYIPTGVVIGASSFVPVGYEFEPWAVYAGVPIKKVGMRNRKRVLQQVGRLIGT